MSIEGIGGAGQGLPPINTHSGVRGTEPARFARVIELEDARRKRMTGPDQIPQEVWDDMARASQLADDLAEAGQALQFDTHALSGRVVATLCDSEGEVLRHVGLGELFGFDPTPAA